MGIDASTQTNALKYTKEELRAIKENMNKHPSKELWHAEARSAVISNALLVSKSPVFKPAQKEECIEQEEEQSTYKA